jgi:pimeloyl-[acyl-carrier protein] methyl ester esterase
MTLAAETAGRGPPLVMLHGWGLHSGVWTRVLPLLQARFRVTRVDLPGHGASRDSTVPSDVGAIAAAVAAVAPPRAAWLGWSLGGQVALAAAADCAQRVERLVLVATTPRFVTAPDWPCAMAADVLAEFAAALAADYRRAVDRFLALQLRGDRRATELLRELRAAVFARGEPSPEALAAGLDLLAKTDLRRDLHAVAMPALVLSGRRDRLTPPEAGRRLAAALPRGEYACFAAAAHAPFLTDPGAFAARVSAFLEEAAT